MNENQRQPTLERRPRLLIVEDDEDYRMALLRAARHVTKDRGWDIEAFGNLHDGERALDARTVGVVVADYNLPDGLGTTLTAHAASDRGRTQRVILTGDASRVPRQPGVVDDVWEKSLDMHEIENRLDAAMARVEFCRYWT